MIKGFENITYKLTRKEIDLAEQIAEKIANNIGKDMVVSNDKIQSYFKSQGLNVSAPRVRKILHALRISGTVKMLAANEKGYYVCKSSVQMREYIAGLGQRIAFQQHLMDALSKQLHEFESDQQMSIFNP